jgi:hypothetical protein
MKKKFWILVLSLMAAITYGQDKVYLNNGQVFKGKVTQNNDSLVVLKVKTNANSISDLVFYKDKVKKVVQDTMKKNGKVTIKLVSGQIIHGQILDEKEGSITLGKIKGLDFGELTIPKTQILYIKDGESDVRKSFLDIGFLRAAALIGADLEIVLHSHATLYGGLGFKGYALGFNAFFRDNFKGPALKFSYLHQGLGNTFAGSIMSVGLALKMRPGISFDLGIGFVLKTGSYNYEGQKVILTYGIGYRF